MSDAAGSSAAQALTAAARALARDCPAAYARVTQKIGPLCIQCRIGQEFFAIEVQDGLLQTRPLPGAPSPDSPLPRLTIDLALSPDSLVNLLDGAFSADRAVRARLLWLRGHPRALADLSRGARAFVHGATFSRGAERVLADFRRAHQNARDTM